MERRGYCRVAVRGGALLFLMRELAGLCNRAMRDTDIRLTTGDSGSLVSLPKLLVLLSQVVQLMVLYVQCTEDGVS